MVTGEEKAAVDAAAKGLTRAAQNWSGVEDFVDALRLWTRDLGRRELVAVITELALQLSAFYGADPMAADAEVTEAELFRWLDQ